MAELTEGLDVRSVEPEVCVRCGRDVSRVVLESVGPGGGRLGFLSLRADGVVPLNDGLVAIVHHRCRRPRPPRPTW